MPEAFGGSEKISGPMFSAADWGNSLRTAMALNATIPERTTTTTKRTVSKPPSITTD
jgi:hypothetical protein